MSTLWVVLSFLIPPLAAVAAGLAFRGKKPDPQLIIALNALMPGAGLAAANRSTLEVVVGVLFAQASLFIVGGMQFIAFFVPIMVIGGVWAALYTPYNPLTSGAGSPAVPPSSTRTPAPGSDSRAVPRGAPAIPPPVAKTTRSARPAQAEEEAAQDQAYSVNVRCTECGADVAVPVLEHMARCDFCGSDHLVVGHEQTLYVTIPEKITSEADLREAVLDHYRYVYYLNLYKRHVSPLEGASAEITVGGGVRMRAENEAAAAAAERTISHKADRYRSQLAEKLQIHSATHFLAPYRHGTGTMYQTAFGRSKKDQEKRLAFAIQTLEAATLATDGVVLPAMGKLSYLRALEPAAKLGDRTCTLPLNGDEAALKAAYGNIDRKQLVRHLSIIKVGSRFVDEVEAVVWRPWWNVSVSGPGIGESLLVDGAAGSVSGSAPLIDPEQLVPLPEVAQSSGSGLRFLPMECPTCGYEFRFDRSALIHFCMNCHRVFHIRDNRKQEIDYKHAEPASDPANDVVPFWEFPLCITTADGTRITDLMHLKDGIDGTLDQLGEGAVQKQHLVYFPAVRFINSKLMAKAYGKLLLQVLKVPPRVTGKRFSLNDKVAPWPVSLPEQDAREVLPLYLAIAFGKRDIARVNIHQVGAWLFEATQGRPGRLVYLPIPRSVTEPFRRYAGRFHAQAVQKLTKTGTTIESLS